MIPGGIGPGSGNDYDKEQNGLTCYSCSYCNVEPFKPEDTGVGTETGCHVCSKEWDDGQYIQGRVQQSTRLVNVSFNIVFYYSAG